MTPHLQRPPQRGFTLIELMIVAAIVAILASIAYPSYKDSVLKGRRAQARTALMEVLQQEERYMTQNNTYLEFDSSSTVFKTFSGDNNSSPAYDLSAQKCDAPSGGVQPDIRDCVRILATPRQPDPEVNILRVTSTGIKDCTGTAWTNNKRLCWP
ncbi:type IV pilin protein [Xylophilus sp. ASV27]|uniref:type IV pilin protein n=1 Tax=Xylophilus sp. ASV27 TaxID=2795129 RepID=UPI0018EDD963|nr:type IV pilin protein [Xylophilus sp. ASV27]